MPHLLTFARLRNLTKVTKKQLENMGITYDIEKDAFFKSGIKKGINKVVINLFKANKLSLEEIAQVSELSIEEVKNIIKEIQ